MGIWFKEISLSTGFITSKDSITISSQLVNFVMRFGGCFRKSTCFVKDLQGNDLLTGNHGSDLYTISLQEMTSSTLICLMAKASPTQSWLWHRRLSHLNFDYINLLSKKDVVIGLPKLKYARINYVEVGKDGENLDKMKEKGDPCILVGYSTQSNGYRVYNKRTRLIVESIHLKFDEIKELYETFVANDTSGHEEGIDFVESFAPVPRLEAVRISVTYVVHKKSLPTQESSIWIETSFESLAKYTLEILKKHDMEKGQSIGTPMATKPKLEADLSGKLIDQTDYLSKIMSLMYLTSSRPDIVQAICYCARYQARPTEKHLKVVKRIFRYLRVSHSNLMKPRAALPYQAHLYSVSFHQGTALPEDRFQYLVKRIGMRCLAVAELEVLILPEHLSDTYVFTVKMEILLEPTSNKLLVGSDDGVPAKSDSLPHAHAQTTKTYYKHQDLRIKKAQTQRPRLPQTLIYKIFLKISSLSRHYKQIVKLELRTIVETPVSTMPDTRTMSELLQVPTEGYGDAIIIPAILAEDFELKVELLQLVTSSQFHGFERDDPHAHIRWFNKITSMLKYKNVSHDAIKLMLFLFSLEGQLEFGLKKNSLVLSILGKISFQTVGGNLLNRTPRAALTIIKNKSKVRISRNKPVVSKVSTTASSQSPSLDVTALIEIVKELVLMNKAIQQATVKAIEGNCVICGGSHPYYECLVAGGNTFNACAAVGPYNQGGNDYRP
nr:uncharacterized mitochondrial protein AtMg00810-like [Tanacetum cinerariifolium]